MLEKFSKALVILYRQAQQSEPGVFRQELLDLMRDLVDCDGGALGVWQVCTTSREGVQAERVRARILALIQQGDQAKARELAMTFFSSLSSPQLLNARSSLQQHPIPWVQALHDDENLGKLMLLGDVSAAQGVPRWIILFRCSEHDFTPREAALLHAFWYHAAQSIDINLQYALSRVAMPESDQSVALVNSLGIIEIADDAVKDLLLQEWPMLNSATLPKTALAALLATGSYRGKFIDLRASRKAGYLACHVKKVHAVSLLTPSEISAVQCFARGMTHSAIACRFGVSPHTVRNQLANAYRKLGVHSKAELIRVVSDF